MTVSIHQVFLNLFPILEIHYKGLYKKRTTIERINSRLDRDYCFEEHTIRGKDKMEIFVVVAYIVMLTLAKSKIKDKKGESSKEINRLVS